MTSPMTEFPKIRIEKEEGIYDWRVYMDDVDITNKLTELVFSVRAGHYPTLKLTYLSPDVDFVDEMLAEVIKEEK